jgi:hypothetical protein
VRSSPSYRGFIRIGRFYLLPFLSALAVVWIAFSFCSHLFFNLADSAGVFCKGTTDRPRVYVGTGQPQDALFEFDTRSLCAPTGLTVAAEQRYEITIAIDRPWTDGSIETSPLGYLSSSQPFATQTFLRLGVGLRRILFRPWNRMIARIGETGVDEYFLDVVPVRNVEGRVYRDEFVAKHSGEVFLYLNEAVIGLPWVHSYFFGNNAGSAKIKLRLCTHRSSPRARPTC